MERQEYPTLLATLEPVQAVNLLNSRLNHVTKTNADFANFFEERRRIEDAYVQGLRRLSRKQPPDAESELGILTTPWQKILEAVRELADSHQDFASRIDNDIVLPLRQFDTQNREMQQMSNIKGNLAAMAKEYDQAQKKSEKLKAQGSKASAGKVAGASDQVDSAQQEWDSQAPYVFEQLQAVDEKRFAALRDLLTQLQTHETDHIEKARAQAEICLNSVLNIDVSEEVRNWSSRRAGMAQRVASRPEAQRTPSREDRQLAPPSTSRSERRMSRNVSGGNTLVPPPTLPVNGDDRNSMREPSINEPVVEEKKKPRGLKRLGTVFSKRRQSMMPSLSRPTVSRNKSSRLGSYPDLTEETVPELPTPQPPSAVERNIPSPAPATSENQLQPSMSETERPSSQRAIPNGVSNAQASFIPTTSQNGASRYIAQTSQPSQSLLPSTQTQHELSSPVGATDTDNFATPPQSASDPISAAQREAAAENAGGYGAMDDEQTQQQQAFNLSIRDTPIAEEDPADSTAAMANVANTLRLQAATPAKRQGTVRGRRDVRNTVFIPSEQAPVFDSSAAPPAGTSLFASPQTMAPLAPPPASSVANSPALTQLTSTPPQPPRPFGAEDRTSDDTQSIRSGRSLASTMTGAGAGAVRHPDMHTPGLSSSIIETVNATFEAGKLVKGNVIGELALSHTPDPTSTSVPMRETVRLDNFPILEKVAPNPAFVQDLGQSSSGERKGEYIVDLGTLGARPNVAFKYQLHVDADDSMRVVGRNAPLLVVPSWKCEDRQTSVIVSYSLQPGYQSQEVTLHNVVIALYLEGTRATQCQSKPTGTFSRDRSMIYWRFEELKLTATPQKALARFTTEAKGKPGRVEARWEVTGAAQSNGSALSVSKLEEKQGGSDPFADESITANGRWVSVNGARKLVSGLYVGT